MNYVEKSYEEIFEEALQDSLESGLISHADEFESFIANKQDISNYYVMDKAVISQIVERIYTEGLTPVYESAKVEYAEGTDLDDIGKIVGISRPQATSAEVECTFTLRNVVEEDINIPEGVIVSTARGIAYQTVESIFIASGESEATVLTRAVVPGVKSKVIEDSLVNVVSELEYGFDVINHYASNGGAEAYTDDEYRYLIMNHHKIKIKGSKEAFEYYFASFNGLESYRLVPNWNGTGTLKVVLDPGYDNQLYRAYQDLQDIVSQFTEDITMFAPTDKFIDIYAIVNVDIDQINPYSTVEKEEIKSKIISAIKIFIDGGYRSNGNWYPGLYLGEDFIPHKLAVFLDDEISELKSIKFTYPTDYIEILDEERGVSNNIVIEMV